MVIDFHYHLTTHKEAACDLVESMDRAGIEVTNLTGGPPDAYWEYMRCRFADNRTVAAAVKRYQGRLIGAAYIDPREQGAVDELNRFLDIGFRCVKMFPPAGFYPDDERFFPLYQRIEEAGVPVLFHAGQTNITILSGDPGVRKATNSKFGHPMNFDMVARLFPQMPIVLAHMGYPHYIEAWSIANANPNVYLDISGGGPWTEAMAVFFNAVGGHRFIPIDFTRVLWGSDNCHIQAEHLSRSVDRMRQMGASPDDWKLIAGDTARMLMKL